MRAGALRHLAIIQKPNAGRTAWAEVAQMYMSDDAAAGSESEGDAGVITAQQTFKNRTRYRVGITNRMRLLFPRDASALAAPITAGATSLTIDSAAGFPDPVDAGSAPYRIRIGSEILIVTAGFGTTTLTVTRGADGTTAAAHAAAASVCVLEARNIISAADPDGRRRELEIESSTDDPHAAEHAGTLTEVADEGAAVTFTKVTQAYTPATGAMTPSTSTVGGSARRVKGDPARYEALGLIESEALTLEFSPTTVGETPALGATVSWNGTTYTVREVTPIAPAGTVIAAVVVVSK